MAQETIRVGIVGAGGNTRAKHLPGLRAQPGVEIVGVANRSQASSEQAARELGIPRAYRDWVQAVEDPETDAIVIGTWPYLHCPVSCAALQSDKHVLCEARMAMDADEARMMLATAQENPHLVAQVVPSPFTLAWDRTIQELLASGYVGELYALEVRGLVPGFADPSAPLSWRLDRDLSGLNTMGMGIWYEAVARWVGHARRLTAMSKVCVKQRPKAGEPGLATVRVPDLVDIVAEMDCGAQAHFRFSSVLGLAPEPAGAWLYGSRGTLHLDARAAKLYGAQAGEQALHEIAIAPEKRGEWRVEEEFINAIRGVEPVRLTTFTEGLKYMQFTEAVARSADCGEAVSLPLFE